MRPSPGYSSVRRERADLLRHVFGCRLDRGPDPAVGGAAADVLDGVDVGIGRSPRAAQEIDRGHDLAGLTEAALRDVEIQPRLLHRVQRVAVGEPFARGGFGLEP